MSNQNTVSGIYNVPAQFITGTSEIVLLVPAQGVMPGYPSPLLQAASGFSVSVPQDLTGPGSALDIHKFKVRLAAKVANPGAGTLTVTVRQVPFANLGTISATGSATSTGAPGSGDVLVHTTAALTMANPSLFVLDLELMWSLAVSRLDGIATLISNTSTLTGPAAISTGGISSGVAAINALNFVPGFTFSAGNAGNSVQVSEFVIERV